MGIEDVKCPLRAVDWKDIGSSFQKQPGVGQVTKKQLPKKIRQIPACYFLSRRSLPSAIALYGALTAAGFGGGMLVETWINKKVKDDGGVIWKL